MAVSVIQQNCGWVLHQGSTKTKTLQRKANKVYLGFTAGGSAPSATDSAYGCIVLVFGTMANRYAVLHKGSMISISSTAETFTLSCSATTLHMGFIEIGNF
ncbi:MAG: hypothetical protein J6A79_00730 [Clostridia bacterium]|nr:hypothetical protein [Clostridia bacterium]